MYLKAEGLAQDDLKKQKRRKWVRYERMHSLSAGHIDWHEWDGTDVKVCVILDDASRMILVGGEFIEINTEDSMLIIDQLADKFWWLCSVRELILDHGSEFSGLHRCLMNSISRALVNISIFCHPEILFLVEHLLDGVPKFLMLPKHVNAKPISLISMGDSYITSWDGILSNNT